MSWGALWEALFREWFRGTALRKRRWISPEDYEWRIPQAAVSYDVAYHSSSTWLAASPAPLEEGAGRPA
eukprot:8141385-Lingulodinium_polyedra.AAC.1